MSNKTNNENYIPIAEFPGIIFGKNGDKILYAIGFDKLTDEIIVLYDSKNNSKINDLTNNK